MAGVRKVKYKGKFTGKWIAEVRMKDVPYSSQTFDTKLEAENWLLQQRMMAGKEAQMIEQRTVNNALDRYLDEVSREKKGYKWERDRINVWKQHHLSALPIKSVTTDMMQDWINKRLQSVKGSTVRRELNLWSALFNTAIHQWKWAEHNPVTHTRKPPKPQGRDRIISDAERDAIAEMLGYAPDATIDSNQKRVAVAFLLALETAMRQSEIWNLSWDDVHLLQRFVRLHDTKNGTARDVPLSNRAIALIQQLDDGLGGRLFKCKQESSAQSFRAAVKLCGIHDMTFHDTRHTAITRLARKLQPLELARMVGHKNLNQLLTYYNETASELAARLD